MYLPFGAQTYTLGSSISSTDTSILLTSFTEPVTGTPYTMVLLNTAIVYGTLGPKTTSSEFISFTGITQNANGTATLTGVTRGLAKKYPFTSDVDYKLPHSGQSQFIISDAPQVFVKYAALDNDNVFTGYNEAPNPLTAQGLVTNQYMLDLINGGSVSFGRVVVTATAGEIVTKDQLVYLKVSDGKWWLCDADTAATVDNVTLGLAQGAGSANGSISGGVLVQGLATLTAFTVTAATKYYASNTAGGISTTAGTTEVTIGMVPTGSTTSIYFFPRFDQQLTEDLQDALAGGGNFGTPSVTNQFITQNYLSSATGLPVVNVYKYTSVGSSTTQFDVTNPAGTTFRYTWDGNGTDPVINTSTFPTGAKVYLWGNTATSGLAYVNTGAFTVTASGTNYFEVTNASGTAETDKTLGTLGFLQVNIPATWSKPAGLKYATIEVQAGGGGGGGSTTATQSAAGGGAGGYSRKIVAVATLGATETVTVGAGGKGGVGTGGTGVAGATSSFGTHATATGGSAGTTAVGGVGGIGSNGNVNTQGGGGGGGGNAAGPSGGTGGTSFYGGGALSATNADNAGATGGVYGGGGGGAGQVTGADEQGGAGAPGVVIVTEYYS